MALNLQISTLPMPEGTEHPGTPDEAKDLYAQYYEITGGESFDGINTGSTEPAAANRDRPWMRVDGSGNLLGWYYWNGSAWALMPLRTLVGTTTERLALTPVQNGTAFWDTTELRLYIYNTTWSPASPIEARVHYDLSHVYPQHQLLQSYTSIQSAWTEIDLTPYISALGLDAVDDDDNPKYTIKAAKIKIRVEHGPSGFGTATRYISARVATDSVYSTTATDVLECYSKHTYDDSQASSSGVAYGEVPPKTGTNSIYWNITGDPGSNLSVQFYLVGFVYTTTDAYFD